MRPERLPACGSFRYTCLAISLCSHMMTIFPMSSDGGMMLPSRIPGRSVPNNLSSLEAASASVSDSTSES